MAPVIELFRGDITTLAVDAIVNAANPDLKPGGAVGMAIVNAAGPELAQAMAAAGNRNAGFAAITPGFNLPAKFVIHAVGPSYRALGHEAWALASAYREAFRLAEENGVRSIALPAISCGTYGFPLDPAAAIAVRAARAAKVERVIFALFSDDAIAAYERALRDDAPEWITVMHGPIKTKAEIHRDGDWHVAAHVWIITPDGRALVQKRSAQKENWPGYWDVSAAGHVSAGERPAEAAVRETFEELGLRIEANELRRFGVAREESVLRDGMYIDREEHELFIVERDVDLSALTLQEEEVDEVMLASLDHLPEPLAPHELEYHLLRGVMGAR
ncbi:MAG TPA: macro domain-containing protein [Thermoanaerobaculia bacterium]|nr:macro domain-containing protein [Thermoanaerobaculia bacterium]